MKNLSIVLNVVLFVAVIVLYVLYFSGHKSPETAMTSKVAGTADATKIVYINTDTLLNNYQLAVELNEAFLKKQEDRRTELNIKAKAIDQEGTEFQRKLQNNGFISEARAIEARDQLLVKQENFRRLQQEMMDKASREQSELNKQLFDEITNFLKEYNKEKGFSIVLSTQLGGNVLYAEDGFDITKEIVDRLNANYKKGEKEVIDQEKSYAQLVRRQNKTKLVAKKSGVVTSTGREYVGDEIDASKKIVEMRSNNKWVLKVKDPESKLRYNMDVSVRLGKNMKDYQHEVKGKVITATDITGVGETDEAGDNVVYVEVSKADKQKYDFEKTNIYVYAVSFSVKNALVVDAEAINQESVEYTNKLYVNVLEDGKIHKRYIVSNYNTETEYLVEQGVSAGQTLAIIR